MVLCICSFQNSKYFWIHQFEWSSSVFWCVLSHASFQLCRCFTFKKCWLIQHGQPDSLPGPLTVPRSWVSNLRYWLGLFFWEENHRIIGIGFLDLFNSQLIFWGKHILVGTFFFQMYILGKFNQPVEVAALPSTELWRHRWQRWSRHWWMTRAWSSRCLKQFCFKLIVELGIFETYSLNFSIFKQIASLRSKLAQNKPR